MARGFQLQDLLGIGNATGNPDPVWGTLSGENATKDAAASQQAALKKAFDAIMGASDKAMGYQAPYTQNAGADFNRQRGLVQSGYYQTPYNKSFTPQQNHPQGFSFNPSQGGASFIPQKQMGLTGYTPPSLPPQGQYAPGPWSQANQPAAAQAPQGAPQGQQGQIPPSTIEQIKKLIAAMSPMNQVNPTTQGAGGPTIYNPQTGFGTPVPQGFPPTNPMQPKFTPPNFPTSGPYGLTGGFR